MEQRRRTMSSSPKKGRKAKKFWMIIGIVLGLALIFFASYKISYGLFSDGGKNKAETTQSTEEDIANMPREELEKKYKDLKTQLEEKEEEIKMLEDRLGTGSSSSTSAPSDTPKATSAPSSSPANATPKATAKATSQPTKAPSATKAPSQSSQSSPPAATNAPKGELMTPDQLANLPGASGR